MLKAGVECIAKNNGPISPFCQPMHLKGGEDATFQGWKFSLSTLHILVNIWIGELEILILIVDKYDSTQYKKYN